MFAYCNNNPLLYIDPTGCIPIFPICVDPGVEEKMVVYVDDEYGEQLLQFIMKEFDFSITSGMVYIDIGCCARDEMTFSEVVNAVTAETSFWGWAVSVFLGKYIHCVKAATIIGKVSTATAFTAYVNGKFGQLYDFTITKYDTYNVTISWIDVIPDYLDGLTILRQVNVSMQYVWIHKNNDWRLKSIQWDEKQTNLYR